MGRPRPIVKRKGNNPWSETLPDDDYLGILRTVADGAEERLQNMITSGEVAGHDSFAAVLLDPTQPRSAVTPVLATMAFGPKGAEYLPYAAVNAGVHYRHGESSRALLADYSHRLGNGDIAWGCSAQYRRAIGGGSGLPSPYVDELTLMILQRVMNSICNERDMRRGQHEPPANPTADGASDASATKWTGYAPPSRER